MNLESLSQWNEAVPEHLVLDGAGHNVPRGQLQAGVILVHEPTHMHSE